MPKIKIDWDERYPDYFEHDSGRIEIELTDAEYVAMKLAFEDYSYWQERLEQLYMKQRHAKTE